MRRQIAKDIYYIGVNDRQKALFENMWPLPYGVAYNSYLITDTKTALIDTVDIAFSELFLDQLDEILEGRELNYLIINHMEPDHSGSIALLRNRHPEVQIVGNRQTFSMLAGYKSITDGLVEVKEGSTLELGSRKLTFYMAPMVHWPEVMVAYEASEGILFSADAFGTYGALNGAVVDTDMVIAPYVWDEMERYYSNIVGKYGAQVQKALQKLSALDIRTICSTHGPVWRENIDKVIGIYDRLSRYEAENGVVIVYGSMYGHTERMAEEIAAALAAKGIKNIAMHNASHSHLSYILRDIFRYKAVIIGAPTYCGNLFPPIEAVLNAIKIRGIKGRTYASFGGFTWAGVAAKKLCDFGQDMCWDTIGAAYEQKQAIKDGCDDKCNDIATFISQRVE